MREHTSPSLQPKGKADKPSPSLYSVLLKTILPVILLIPEGKDYVMHENLDAARSEAAARAKNSGESFCIVSGKKNECMIYRVYPRKGFGLPPGGVLEEVVTPEIERIEIEPQEKISTNGF